MRVALRSTLVYSLFWALAFVVLLSMFMTSSQMQWIDYVYTMIFMLTLMAAVEVNEGYLRRKFLKTGKYTLWILLTVVNINAFALFNHILFDTLIDYILPGYYFISYYDYFDLLKFFASFVGLGSLIGFSIEWFDLQEERQKIASLEKEKVTAEFKALVSQVNPHFLFNGLTVLYTLSLKDSRETSSAIIKLSDILRYVIYRSNDEKVSLASEAAILKDYIDLQRYRVHPTTQIDFVESFLANNAVVAPMLFLPLVENAFKHGVHGETENAFVRIALREQEGVVNFTIANNKPASVKTDVDGGIGLKNLKERLALLYPQRHSLVISETEKVFNIELQITSRSDYLDKSIQSNAG